MNDDPAGDRALEQRLRRACAELERRVRAGSPRAAEEVLAAAPELAGDPEAALELIYAEYVLRAAQAGRPADEEWYRRFPQHRERLERLFTLHAAAGVSAPPRETLERVSGEPAPGPGAPGPPAAGSLELQEEVGRGGMGVVYKARQPGLNRTVAVKVVLAGGHAEPQARARFRREAEAVARLQHPNVAQVYEVGERDGLPYFAMEFVAGGSLERRLARGPLMPRQSAGLVEVLARAVQAAHQAGIVHRDLKPGNVLLAGQLDAPLEQCDPKIVDFGLAKWLHEAAASAGEGPADADARAWRTQTGAVVGTPSYMAPEQAGAAAEVGPAADVYALGAILYECLTARPPFRAATALETLLQVRAEEPVSPRLLNARVPRDLETVCLKCLQKEPARRYGSALELAGDLRRFLAGEPIVARPVGPAERALKWARRRPAVAGLLAAVLILLTGGLTAVSWLWWLAEERRREAEGNLARANEQRDLARTNLRHARAAVDDYCLKVSNDERLRENFRPLRKELLQTAVPFYERFVAQQTEDEEMRAELGRGCLRLGALTQEIGDPKEAIPRAEQAREIFTSLSPGHAAAGDYAEDLAETLQLLGRLYRVTSQIQLALERTQAAVALRRELADRHPNAADPLRGLGVALLELGYLYRMDSRFDDAEKHLRQALEVRKRLVARHPEVGAYQNDLLGSHSELGLFFRARGRMEAAEKAYREALALGQRLTARHPEISEYRLTLARVYNNVGLLYKHTHRYAAAERAFRHALALHGQLLASNPEVVGHQVRVAGTKHNLGLINYSLNNNERALTLLREAVAMMKLLVAKYPEVTDHALTLGSIYGDLALTVRQSGKREDSLSWYALAVKTLEDVRKRHPRNTLLPENFFSIYTGRARTLTLLGRHAEALPDWDAACAVAAGPRKSRARLARADALVRLGRHAQATAEATALAGEKAAADDWHYDLACVYSLGVAALAKDASLTADERARLTELYATAAVGLLRKAKAAGELNDPKAVAQLKKDEDLHPLRSREDFKKFLAELDAKGSAAPG
jgi:tetratricopeptide (TPR) repeat protein/predicted Ser/Thr protein kinase